MLDVDGRGAEVAPAEVRPFSPEVLDRRPAASVGANLGDGVLCDRSAEMVRGQVARLWVDVEAVGRVCSVDGERGAVDNDCYVQICLVSGGFLFFIYLVMSIRGLEPDPSSGWIDRRVMMGQEYCSFKLQRQLNQTTFHSS